MKTRIKKIFAFQLIMLAIGFLLPQSFRMPANVAARKSFSQDSFWLYPWGESVTHKGVDIFTKRGTSINSSTYGIVLYQGQIRMGGNIVLILGPKWRRHYYAHLDSIKTSILRPVSTDNSTVSLENRQNSSGLEKNVLFESRHLLKRKLIAGLSINPIFRGIVTV